MLHAKNLHFSYGEDPLLKGISFQIKEQEIVALIGTSGSGKTTLFRLITGLLPLQRGTITIEGSSLPEGASSVTYMCQEDLLLPWRTIEGNLLLFTELGKGVRQRERGEEKAHLLLKKVGLEEYTSSYPEELSGGMRQRVSLVRALMQERPLLLLDEPFGSLDVIAREHLYHLLREVRQTHKKTLLFVTHDFRDAMALADRILILNGGTISAEFSIPEDLSNDATACAHIADQIRAELSPGAIV